MSDERTATNLEKLRQTLAKGRNLLIVMQDNPDPDAIAAAVGLRELANRLANLPCSLAHGGIVGRAENRAMVRYLGLKLRDMARVDARKFDLVALVDTQPGTGNNLLDEQHIPDIVIDHHPIRNATRRSPFTDVRSNYGATASILFEYLKAAGIPIETPVATALLYGIRSDTQDLGREACRADADAYLELYPKVNKRILAQIARATVPTGYFQIFSDALTNARIQGRCLTSFLGCVDNPDMIAEIADMLLRHDPTDWVLCMGVQGGVLRLSMRTSAPEQSAGEVMQKLLDGKGTGGGHDQYAGGQILLTSQRRQEVERLRRSLFRRFAELLDCGNRRSRPLVRQLPG